MKRITIDPVTRIEGHARITIHLDDSGEVASTQFHVTQVRGFERFVEGRPFYEMPGITARICGICPISHLLASAKACESIMAVRIPQAALLLRELIHCGQFVQSHALSFFHLSAPDLLLGMSSDIGRRNILGLAEKHPQLARDGIELRKFGQRIIEAAAGERVHPSGIVPGGIARPLEDDARDAIRRDLAGAQETARKALAFFKTTLDGFSEEIAHFGSLDTMFAGLVDAKGTLQLYDGAIRFRDGGGAIVADVRPEQYAEFIGEAALPDTYLKAPYFRSRGYSGGIYRVGPLARLNVAGQTGIPDADAELEEFRQRFGPTVTSSFHYHYARLIELVYALGKIQILLDTPEILETQVRARASVNALEGIGVAEAPRGILIHHYKVDEQGAMRWANLIIATGHNNLAINRSVEQAAKHFVHGGRLEEGMLNRVSAVVRAYDPCLSCSTHAGGLVPLRIELVDSGGRPLDEITT